MVRAEGSTNRPALSASSASHVAGTGSLLSALPMAAGMRPTRTASLVAMEGVAGAPAASRAAATTEGAGAASAGPRNSATCIARRQRWASPDSGIGPSPWPAAASEPAAASASVREGVFALPSSSARRRNASTKCSSSSDGGAAPSSTPRSTHPRVRDSGWGFRESCFMTWRATSSASWPAVVPASRPRADATARSTASMPASIGLAPGRSPMKVWTQRKARTADRRSDASLIRHRDVDAGPGCHEVMRCSSRGADSG
mmetsp:Transcript_11478/g.44497  ORF Transcript_11478/g.44497 Transcript_11478/m.44497 type:complete len:258 (-) Transcript_11478:504-1277(-)